MQSVACLLAETLLASKLDIEINVLFMPSCANIALGRNQLVKEFLASDSDRLVFLDADVTFEPGSLINIATHPVDFVGGAYRFKTSVESYPVQLLSVPKDHGPNGLVEVAMVPTGFLSLSRKVFEKFEAHYPDRRYQVGGKESFCYFQMPFVHGALFGEDSYFCREWREAGGTVYLDPNLTLTHWHFNTPFRGNFHKWATANIQSEASI